MVFQNAGNVLVRNRVNRGLFWETPLIPFTFTRLTGERGRIPEDTMEAMRAAGLAHLLAISGLHVGLVTGILFFGLRALLALSACSPDPEKAKRTPSFEELVRNKLDSLSAKSSM